MGQPTVIPFGAGSVRGIGGSVAKRFAREGYHVIVTGRTLGKIEEVVVEIAASQGGSAEAIRRK
ncbi:SDR family NAD(P)-dependent oxidoreductase [Burkholderia sp. Ac-20353]|uniref:SDR family NAD(P)-dependent oxidoreductase n=1 Tax=Burkholderia sp. Ac-20353 TaxID=2703894 RepID=UPI00197B1AAD|nr:SDR family NAD(P)-dependent oxidoreductase [Burkholderia sp. Ac-20353]